MDTEDLRNEITALHATEQNLRAAIEAHEAPQASVVQEPVAKIVNAGDMYGKVEWLVHSGRPIKIGQMLYTHPAPVREPLTYVDRRNIIISAVNIGHAIDLTEAAHGITKEQP